jgi:hypothetical protein
MEIQKRLGIATALLGASFMLLPHPWNFTPLMRLFAAISQVFLPQQQAA